MPFMRGSVATIFPFHLGLSRSQKLVNSFGLTRLVL